MTERNEPVPSPVEREVVIERIFDASRELVFDAWTDPKHVVQWWGPHGFTNPVCEMDVRPGGTLLIHMRGPDGAVYPTKGVFHEVVPPERLVVTSSAFEDEKGNPQLEVLNTVTFDDLGGKTKLTLRAVVVKSAPEVEAALAGMEEGWNQSLDKLAEHLAKGEREETMVERKIGSMTLTVPSDREIVMTRELDAPRELVFEAHTTCEHMKRWWGPRKYSTTVCEIDFRPGGAWHIVQRGPDGDEYGFKGVFKEIVPPERIVWTFEFEGMLGHVSLQTLTFEEQDGKTKLTATVSFDSVEERDGMLESGMETGAAETYDRLAKYLQTMA